MDGSFCCSPIDHQAALRRARDAGSRDVAPEVEMGDRPSDSIGSRPGALSDHSNAVLKSVKTAFFVPNEGFPPLRRQDSKCLGVKQHRIHVDIAEVAAHWENILSKGRRPTDDGQVETASVVHKRLH